MTVTQHDHYTPAAEGGIGRVARVIGPVVDVEFAPDEMPVTSVTTRCARSR